VGVGTALVREFPTENKDWNVTAVPISQVAYGRGFWIIIALFMGAVFLVMVIACANAASLVLARATARRRETALRAALGAGRWRLVRQALIEGILLSLLSAVVAVPAAEFGLRLVRTFDTPEFQQLRLDGHELSFVVAIAVLTPLLFSVLPTLSAIRFDLRTALQSGGVRSGVSTRGRAVLVGMQLALAVTLLLTAGLAIRTAVNIATANYGIRTTQALIFSIDLQNPVASVANPSRFLEGAQDRLARIPGVVSVSILRSLPVLSGESVASLEIPGAVDAARSDKPWAIVNGSDEEGPQAIGLHLVTGRWLTPEDAQGNGRGVLVSETATRMYFGTAAQAVGKPLTLIQAANRREVEIVGVVSDVLSNDIERGPVPRVWTGLDDMRRAAVMITTQGDGRALANSVRLEMAALAPMLPLEGLETIEAAFARFRASDEAVIAIFSGFALLALVLAAAGLYGLITYMVSLRVQEFGTRFALGARRSDVLGLVFRQVARLIAIGLTVGVVSGLAIGQAMGTILYGVTPTDPLTIAAVIVIIALVAILASLRPALRAARINLVDALRAE
jgi:predicted permease